ncbi:MAG: GNAT family N-acetyltransferase [Pseudomonadota bacterium]
MSEGEISYSIEGLTEELLQLYLSSTMSRAEGGRPSIEWRFKNNPLPFCVGRIDGEVVGLSAYIQTKMRIGEETGTAIQAVDSYTPEKMRGRGIFTKLAEAYHAYAEDAGIDLVWCFPNPAAGRVWYGKLGWTDLNPAPFLVKPLRAGYLLRKLRIPFDFPLSTARDQGLEQTDVIEDWVDECWDRFVPTAEIATHRHKDYLRHRLLEGPLAASYRVVTPAQEAFVATRRADKHGGRIGYVMEAFGPETALREILASELARMRDLGTEVALAWAYPWQANYRALRRAGFFPLPERLRPVQIRHGCRPISSRSDRAKNSSVWHLSYLDSDTV